MKGIVGKVLAWAAILGLTSLLVMLALGILHARAAGIPALGYLETACLILAARGAFMFTTGKERDK